MLFRNPFATIRLGARVCMTGVAPSVLVLTAALTLATVGAHAQTFEIVSANSGLVLDVPGWSTQPGTQIQQWTENSGANQQWTFASLGATSISVVGQRNQTGGYIKGNRARF